jgi:hypothetical protein
MLTGDALTSAQAPPSSTTIPSAPSTAASTTNAAPAANPAAPPSASAQRSDADLDKLVAPIALYPDPLLATVLPASAYPLEIVQAARFVTDTNNIAKLDSQSWDDNVKAVARFPDVIKQMDENIQWTSDLGDAFINQPKGVTDAIQRMRSKAQSSGALKTTPQQVVNVTNTVVTNVVESKTVIVTNQVVQIQPSQPDVIYVPQYNPTVVYAGYPVAYPGYVYPPYYPLAGAAVSFGVGMACGAIIANNCDWGHGGCWGGSYHADVNVNRNVNVNNNVNRNNVNVNNRQNVSNRQNASNQQKWQPDQNRLKNSGSTMSSAQNREARGYGSGTGANRSTAASQRASAAQNLSASERSYSAPNRSGSTTPRASSTPNRTASTTPRSSSADSRLSPTGPSGNRPSSESFDRPSSQGANRPSSSQSYNRPSSSSSSQSAFSGSGGGAGSTRAASSRGSMSRGGGGGGRRR